MSQQMETTEGNGEMDIGTWLINSRLSKYKDRFIEDEVSMDDILTWNEKENKFVWRKNFDAE